MKAVTVALSLIVASPSAAAVRSNKEQATTSSINNERAIELTEFESVNDVDDVDADMYLDEMDLTDRHLQSGPNSSTRATTWRKAHNNARRKYHALYGGTFTPIKFNQELKADAEAWAKTLVQTCVNRAPDGKDENPNSYGVNSMLKSRTRDFQSITKVMQLWENKLPLGYPKNGVMTQVLWTKTTLVGCADVSSELGAEKNCTASVCFYAKAGNCAFGRFEGNWTRAVMEGPACSTACPSDIDVC